MIKNVLILLFSLVSFLSFSQKFAYVDTDYILSKLPEYNQAQEKIDNYSKQWQEEIENNMTKIEKMYKSYQSEQILLTDQMKKSREDLIFSEEKKVACV